MMFKSFKKESTNSLCKLSNTFLQLLPFKYLFKNFSFRTQLSGLRRAYCPDDGEHSPATMKRLLLLKAREKYLKNTSDVEAENTEQEADSHTQPPFTDQYGTEETVVPRSPKRRLTGDRALLQRLSALSSQRSSTRSSIGNTLSSIRSSKSNSSYNYLDSVGEVLPLPAAKNGQPQTSAEIYNVLRKLHDSIDQLESEDLDPNQPDNHRHTIGAEMPLATRQDAAEVVRKHRQSDPLLPEERTIIEGLLMKYNHLEGGGNNMNNNNTAMVEPLQRQEEKITFSSKVKIKGASPHHSRKTSIDNNNKTPPTPVARRSSVSTNNSNLIAEEVTTASGDFSSSKSSLVSEVAAPQQHHQKTRRNSLPHHNKDNTDTVKQQKAPPTIAKPAKGAAADVSRVTPKGTPRMRKISTVKEFTRRFEEKQFVNRGNEPRFNIVPEQKYYHVSSDSESSGSNSSDSDSSSDSEYEDRIVKTNEGFIIPDEAITKLSFNKIAKAQRLREEQEEIERQFKKENFLKDLPARRGIRMPVGSAGKVNQLKSKFESTLIGKLIIFFLRSRRTSAKENKKVIS